MANIIQSQHASKFTHCNTLQHTATHCNTLQHTATHCNTLICCQSQLTTASNKSNHHRAGFGEFFVHEVLCKMSAPTMCYSVLQCVAVRCSALHCVTVCFSMLQCIAVHCSVLQRVAACCSVLQRVVHTISCKMSVRDCTSEKRAPLPNLTTHIILAVFRRANAPQKVAHDQRWKFSESQLETPLTI